MPRFKPIKSDKSIDHTNVNDFYKFIFERQAVWHNRFVLKLPQNKWTKNPILREYKYTNVYRELDYGTVWLLQNIIPQEVRDSSRWSADVLENIVWQVCQYRLLNKVETFERVGIIDYASYGDTGKRADFFDDLTGLQELGYKLWTDAHITLQTNFKQNRLQNFECMLDKLYPAIPDITKVFFFSDSIEQAFNRIKEEYGFGPFTSYEVVSDIAYIPWSGIDPDEWANAGPGCKLGLKILFPNITGAQNLARMFWLRDKQQEYFENMDLPMEQVLPNGKWLNLRDIEHSLCEYGKYHKQCRGMGKARTRFVQKNPATLYDMV